MLPHFQPGQPLKASDLETLVRHIRDNEITSVVGGRLSRVSGGQSIIIDPPTRGGGGGTVCPFLVQEANKSPEEWAITIAWGLVGMPPVLPDGMTPTDDPKFSLKWTDGWVCMKVDFVKDDTAIQSVSFEISENIPEADETYAYYPIAYIFTTIVDSYQIQNIRNLCSAPTPSVCDLKIPKP